MGIDPKSCSLFRLSFRPIVIYQDYRQAILSTNRRCRAPYTIIIRRFRTPHYIRLIIPYFCCDVQVPPLVYKSLWDSSRSYRATRHLFLNKVETTPFNAKSFIGLFYFPICPDSFEIYLSNAGYLSEPLFELLLFGLLSTYSIYSNLPTWLTLARL